MPHMMSERPLRPLVWRSHTRSWAPVWAILAFGVACQAGSADVVERDITYVAKATDSSEPHIALPVAVSRVADGDLVLSIATSGRVRSEEEATLRFEVPGTVAAVHVSPGDRVKKGTVVATLDRRPFDIAVRRAEIEVSAAQLRYAQQMIDSAVTGSAPNDAQRLAGRLRSGMTSAELALEQAELDRARATIIAPFSGSVDRFHVAVGSRVGAGQALTTIVNTDRVVIEATVLEHDLLLIRPGGSASLRTVAAPGARIAGKVVAVLPLIDSVARAGRALIRPDDARGLRPGMYADLWLESSRLRNRRLVPSAALIERDGRSLVFRVSGGRAKWIYVNGGRTNGVQTEILRDSSTGLYPLKPGDTVIVAGHLTITHDAAVRVTERDPN